MVEQLASLLLPIDALLAHSDFDLQYSASPELVALFRNMWFLCVLFHFTTDNKQETAMDWQQPALARIAAKTPPMILEEAHDSLASELEYNSVIRQEYAHTVSLSFLNCSTVDDTTYQGHLKTSLNIDTAHLHPYKRYPVFVFRPGHLFTHYARSRDHAFSCRTNVLAGILLHQCRPQ